MYEAVSASWCHSRCSHLHREWDAGESLQLLFHPISPQPFQKRTPPLLQTCFLSYEHGIVITPLSLLHSLKSLHHSKLVTSPGKWEQQLLWGSSHVPCCSHHRAAAPRQRPAQLPTACSTGKITGTAVFFKGKIQYG